MAKKAVPQKSGPTKGTKPKTEAVSQDDLEAAWGESRAKAPPSGSMDIPDIPDAEYLLQVSSAKVSAYKSGNKKGARYLGLSYVIVAGPHKGVVVRSKDDISTRPIGDSGLTALDYLSGRLQKLGVDTKKFKLGDLPTVAKNLSDPKTGKPFVVAAINTKTYTKDDGTEGAFMNVYLDDQGPVAPAEVEKIKAQLDG